MRYAREAIILLGVSLLTCAVGTPIARAARARPEQPAACVSCAPSRPAAFHPTAWTRTP